MFSMSFIQVSANTFDILNREFRIRELLNRFQSREDWSGTERHLRGHSERDPAAPP